MNHQLVKTTSSTQAMQYTYIIYKQFGPRAFADFSVGELVPNVGGSSESKDHAIDWNQIALFMVYELVKLELSLRAEDILPSELLKYTCWWVVRMVRNVKEHPLFIISLLEFLYVQAVCLTPSEVILGIANCTVKAWHQNTNTTLPRRHKDVNHA